MSYRSAVVLAAAFVVAITLFNTCMRAGIFVEEPQSLHETDPDSFCRARCKGMWQSYRRDPDGREYCSCARND